jgi:hypothetical protein
MIYGISSWLGNRYNTFIKVQDAETDWMENVLDFYCNNAEMPPGRAF